tara:strand:+ start:44 stop:856 length:813 start_codon:yes stop_codon:yes gene_type:complete
MKLSNIFSTNVKLPVEIIFQGGLGSQLVSYASYLYLRDSGKEVYCDLSYYHENKPSIAEPGEGVSFWKYELDSYGIDIESLIVKPENIQVKRLEDEEEKFILFSESLKNLNLKEIFKISEDQKNIYEEILKKNNIEKEKLICVHIRRGDYLNVASHIVKDEEFIGILEKFSGILDSLLIFSDSKISKSIKEVGKDNFKNFVFLDQNDVNAINVHNIMRNARILVASNSTFSLTAGLLNKNIILIPKTWYGSGRQDGLNDMLSKLGNFSLI